MDVCFLLMMFVLCCRVFVVMPVLDDWSEFKVSPFLAGNVIVLTAYYSYAFIASGICMNYSFSCGFCVRKQICSIT